MFFGRIQNIFLCIVILIFLALDDENLPTAYPRSQVLTSLSLPLLLDILVIIIRESYYYNRQRQYDSQINNQNECQRLVRFKGSNFQDKEFVPILEKTKWGSLQIGDIILLKKDDYCPADILILDMWDQKCTVKTSFIDDKSEDTIKYAPLLTTISKGSSIKGNLLDYRRVLSGRIDIKKTDDIYNFRGYLGLKKDPISEKFGNQNLIQKYSQIKYTDWLVGIVVLCGNDSYSFRQQSFEQKEKKRRQPSYFKRKWDIQSIIQIMMVCFYSLIVIILRISMSCFKSLQFKGQMIPIAIDFIFTFPSYCSVVNSITFCLYTSISNYLFNQNKDPNQNSTFGLNYLNSFGEMALSSHIIFNSLKIQNQKSKNISTVCLKDRYFKMIENQEGFSNQNIKSTNTLIRTNKQFLQTKSEIGEDLSYMNSPISNLNQKSNSHRFLMGNGLSNFEGGNAGGNRKKSLTNWNQISSSNADDSQGNSITSIQQISSGYSVPQSAFKKQSLKDKAFPLQKIMELDSKSVLPYLDNESQKDKDDTQHDSGNKIASRHLSDIKSISSLKSQKYAKKDSLIEFEETSNFQTFAENNDIDNNSVRVKVDAHLTRNNVSISQLNQQDLHNISQDNNVTVGNITDITHRKANDDADITYTNVSQRALMQGTDALNDKTQQSISQNNSPKNNRKIVKATSLQTSQYHYSHSNSRNLQEHTDSGDQLNFMKGSFAPFSIHQQIFQLNKGRSGSQCDSSLVIRNSLIKENTQKNAMIISFDNISLYEKDYMKRQEQKSPSKIQYYTQNIFNNGSGQVSFFGQSPRWRPQSGTLTNPNSGSNGSLSNINNNANNLKILQQTILQNELFQNNTEQSQQVTIQLEESQVSVQIEGKNHQVKDSSDEDFYSKKRTSIQQHISPNNFKTAQTGQALKKSLVDDYKEYEIRSDDEDNIIEEQLSDDHYKEEFLDDPSGNNLICNFLNSSPLEAFEKNNRHSETSIGGQQNFPYLTLTTEPKHQVESSKAQNLNVKKLNIRISTAEQEEISNKSNKQKQQNANIENLNLITSELECSNTQSNLIQVNAQSLNVDRLFNAIQYQQQNLGQIPIQDSQCEYQESQQNEINNNFLSDQKYERVKRKKSFTSKEKTLNNINNNQNTISNFSETQEQEEGTPKNNNLFHSSEQAQISKTATMRGIQLNPLIQRFKQNNSTTQEDINSAESLQKRLSVSSMLPSTHNILAKQPTESFRMGSNINLVKKPLFENQQGFNKALLEKNQATKDLLFAMTICHETKSKGDRQKSGKKIQNVHFDEDTQYILDFTRNHNVSFECQCSIHDQNYYIIKTDEGKDKVQILQKFTSLTNKKMFMIVQQQYDIIMIVKQQCNSIPDYLNNVISSEKKQKLESLLTKVKKQGEKIIFYSKILLNEQQHLDLSSAIRLETSSQKIENIYQQFVSQRAESSNEIQLLGFLGIQEEHDMLIKEMVRELRTFGQKIWVLTSDSQLNTLESSYNYNILQDNGMDILDFSSPNFDELFYKTRNHLQILKKAFQNEMKSNSKDTMNVSQSVVDPAFKEMNPTLTNVKEGSSTPLAANGQNQKFVLERKSTFSEQQNNRKTISKMPSQGLISKKKTNTQFGGTIEDNSTANNIITTPNNNNNQNTPNEKQELNYYMIISGESLNVLRNNTYLWDHFCLIAFFASGVIGYEITDEQKSILGQTITTRFHRSQQRVVNIISSLNDIESLNYDQISVYIGNPNDIHNEERSKIISQHPDIYTKDSMSFLNILIRESKLQSEIIEETMYLAIHRSYLTAIVIIVWNIMTCACNYPLFTPYQQIFFHGFQYTATFFYYIRRKREKFNHDKENDKQGRKIFYKYFNDFKNQYSPQQIPILNLKIIISAIFDVLLIFLFYSALYNFQDGMEMDIEVQANLLQWGVYLVSFCRVFDLHFIKFDRYLIIYIFLYVVIMIIETAVIEGEEVSVILMDHTFKNLYFLNSILFLCFYVAKSIMEGILVNTTPISIVGLSKYILKSKQQKEDERKRKENPLDLKAQTSNNTNQIKKSKNFFENSENGNRSPDKIETGTMQLKEDMSSPNQIQSKNSVIGNNINTAHHIQKSEMTSNNSLSGPILSSALLKGMKKKVNPAQIIRSIFKDKEMDIILSSILMQEDINLSQTQMQRFTLKFQIKEIEANFLKGWELLVPYSNRIFYVFNFIAFDIGYDVLVLSKVTNEFSSADGGYVMSYAITASAIFIITSLTLSKYYARKNIVIFSVILVIVRSIKLILLSSFKEIIVYPTELIMQLAVASSCLRFSHYNIFFQGILLFFFLIILTETNAKKWNLDTFLEAIGYIYNGQGGYSDSMIIVRICFYISYFIILALFVTEKYNMMLTIRTNYLSEHNLFKATMKVKDILSILLPKFIREKIETMKQGQYRVSERQDEVVIVFCDICNFDDLIFNEKTNTVKILDRLYRQFDLACQQNGLQKIETVGKTYLAAAGISDVEKLLKAEGRLQDVSPAKRALTFAFDLQRICKSKYVYLASNKKIIIKVGIHLGPAISGVIGYHKPQFSLIGDTVNTTSRVCSTGLSDHIIISKEVYDKVYLQSSQYKFQQRDVEAKGKGTMITFQVFDKRHLRQNAVKKQTLNFLDDTALINNSNTQATLTSNLSSFQQLGSGVHNFLSSHNQFHQQSGTQNLLENSSEKNLQEQSNHLKKNNSNKFIPLKAIPESPSNTTSNSYTKITDFKIIQDRGEDTNTSTKTAQLQPHSDQYISKSPSLQVNQQRSKQTSFGGAIDAITSKPLIPGVNGEATPQRRGRLLKKSSSMTVVDVKPRFKNDSVISNGIKRSGSGKEEIIEENVTSPLAPSKNEFIKQIEKDLLMRIELEPEQIVLKELTLPLEKIQMHISHQDHGGGEKSLGSSRDEVGSSHSSHLRLGICSTSGKATAEQKQLHTEFLKSILKQQVSSVIFWLFIISIYFLVKIIIIINFINNQNENLKLQDNNQLNLTIFSVCMLLIYFPLAFSFRKLHNFLSWKAMRIFLYSIYFISLLFASFHDSYLDTYLDSICEYNLPLHAAHGHQHDEAILDSVTRIIYPSSIIYILEIQFIFMFFTTFKSLYFIEKVGALIFEIIMCFIYLTFKDELDSTILFFLTLVGIVHLRIQYNHMQNEVRNFNNLKTLESKKEELDSLLKNLLPAHILDQFLNQMKKEIPLVCEELDDVTLLFADIAGFTKYSSTTDPIVVVNMLRKLFTDFDDHCLSQNVYKLYTIGDCYVCFGLTNKNDRNPAQEAHNVVRFGFDMIRIIDNVRQYTDCNLQMRIGIHTGKLYGGIVGTEIVRYDIYGQDVIIANKMESNGESGHVMVSETTKKLLEDQFPNEFIFDFKESVHIKQANKDIDGFLIRFNENTSVYLENPPEEN